MEALKLFVKDLYYFIVCYRDKEVRHFYYTTYKLLFDKLVWWIFGYLLIVFLRRKSFTISFSNAYFDKGDIIKGNMFTSIVLNSKIISLMRVDYKIVRLRTKHK